MPYTQASMRHLTFIASIGVFGVGVSYLIGADTVHWTWSNLPVHAALEGFGAFACLTAALLIVLMLLHGRLRPEYWWLASGLVGMGVLDGLHGACHPGVAFVWLHSAAMLAGGILFASVWLPCKPASHRAVSLLPVAVLLCSIAVGTMSIVSPGLLPAMKGEQGFTFVAKSLNVVGGVGFLIAFLYFLMQYRDQGRGALVWAGPCLLFGVAGLLFVESELWNGGWWLWHILRVAACGVILYYFFVLYHQGQVELRQSRESLLHDLGKRAKELDCLFNLSRTVETLDVSVADILTRAVELLPPSFQYPDVAGARIRCGEQVFETARYQPDAPQLTAELNARSGRLGDVAVSYGALRPEADEGLFLREERALLDAFAERLGCALEHTKDVTALQEWQAKYRTLVENLPQRIFVKDRDCNFVSCNEAFANDLGIAADEICGRSTHEFFPGSLGDKYVGDDNRIMEEGQTREFDEAYVENGCERIVHTVKTPVRDDAGNVTGILGMFWDITERKQAEAALSRSRRELAIRNRIADSFLTISDDAMYADVLETVLDTLDSDYGVFGYLDESGDLIVPSMSRHAWDMCQVADKRTVFARDTWGNSTWPCAIREKRTIWSNKPSTRTPPGHIAITRHVSLPIIHKGEVVGLIQVANKATDYCEEDIRLLETIGGAISPVLSARLHKERQEKARANAEQLLGVKAEELARSNAELEQFAYIASHDLKAPLRAISNLSKWIEEDLGELLQGDARENMDLMRGRVQRLETLLDDLLAFSRAGRVGTEVQEMDTADAVEEIISLLDPPDGMTVRVLGDLPTFQTAKGPLDQALRNLIGNAIKHHDKATGHVDISVEDNGDFYEFTVADDGPGIPTELREKAFQMFQTLKPRDEVEGSGMGLAVVKKLIEWQGGTVQVNTGPDGRGAVFRFTWKKDWPCKEAELCLAATP